MKSKKAKVWIERLQSVNRLPDKLTPKEKKRLNALDTRPRDADWNPYSLGMAKGADGVWRQQ